MWVVVLSMYVASRLPSFLRTIAIVLFRHILENCHLFLLTNLLSSSLSGEEQRSNLGSCWRRTMVESVKKIFLAEHFVSKLLIPVRYVCRLLLEMDKDSDIYILEINSNKYQF